MGRARIVGGGENGFYQAVIEYEVSRIDAEISSIDSKVTELDGDIPVLKVARNDAEALLDSAIHARDLVIYDYNQGNAEYSEIVEAQKKISPLVQPYVTARNAVKEAEMRRMSLIKRKQLLESAKPADQTVDLWCADFTESLSSGDEVPTIEVNGESAEILLAPQYSGRSWAPATDGQFQPVHASGPSAVWLNWSLFPAWQKWLPTYRVGSITAINLDKCDVALDAAISSEQAININQSSTLSNIPFEYMECGAGAFEIGDRVVVQFENQDWTKPKVVGFESNPKPCAINDFLTVPRSDDAVDGWGLPATDGSGTPINGGLGTEGGINQWIKIRTANYDVTRFIEPISHGNLYFKPKNFNLPILSWTGPQNGYLFNTSRLTTYGIGGNSQQGFSEELYAYGKKIGQCDLGHAIAGAAVIESGAGYRLYIATVDIDNAVRLEYADVADLDFDSLVTSWVTVAPPSNPATDGGEWFTDGTVSFNQSGTKCIWMYGGYAYQWTIASNAIAKLSLDSAEPDSDPVKPIINVTDSFADYVDDPCGGPDPWPKTITQTESLTQDWESTRDHHKLAAAVDYVNDEIVVLWKETKTFQAEAFSYESVHTHTRGEVCGAGYPTAVESLNFSGAATDTAGFHFTFDGGLLSYQSTTQRTFGGGAGEERGVSTLVSEVNELMRIRVEGAPYTTSLDWVERETYIRHADIKGRTAIVTCSETIYVGEDTDGTRMWNQTRRHYLQANGLHHTFWTEDFGTHREPDILDENNNIIVYDPREPLLSVRIASDRYSQNVFASISDASGNTLLNYLTGADPVILTEIYGANPRFDPIAVI